MLVGARGTCGLFDLIVGTQNVIDEKAFDAHAFQSTFDPFDY